MPLVSIVTPIYNAQNTLTECINSILAQGFTDYELLLINDASTDDSLRIAELFAAKHTNIKVFFNQYQKGIAGARNTALAHAKGRYIAFLDADDAWLPQKLEQQLHFMQKNNAAFSFTAYKTMDSNGVKSHKQIHVPSTICYHAYLKNTIIGCLTVMIDRAQTGDFLVPNLRTSEDMALWLLIFKRGFVAHGLNQPLAYYRQSPKSATSNKLKAAQDVWFVYRKIEKLGFFYSSFCLCCYAFHALKKRL